MSPTASSSASPRCSIEVMMLSADQCRSLRCLAEMMIPASAEYGVPSAGDDAIFGDILQSVGRDAGHVIAVLQTLDAMSGGPFADLDPQRRDPIANQLRDTGGPALHYPPPLTLASYFTRHKVQTSAGHGPP